MQAIQKHTSARSYSVSLFLSSIAFLICALVNGEVNRLTGQETKYELTEDSKPQDGVPKGEIKGPFPFESSIFPGTQRDYWLYVPAQYDGSQDAALLVIQDGLGRAQGWHLPNVMDNLIHRKEMPITIGVFVNPGVVPAPHDKAQPRFNRSFEYDGMSDAYVRFLLEELLPEVNEDYRISDDPSQRAIGGASSGAVCAFTAAWHRPDQFRRVLSTIGTYVGLRGGNDYPTLLRKMERKPLRVFLQDGSSDLNIYAGDWWTANRDMLSAMQFAGYDVRHVWGDGGHNSEHAAAIMPEAMRWLWNDDSLPGEGTRPSPRRVDLLIEGEGWELVSEGHQFAEGPAVAKTGELYFSDVPGSKIHRVNLKGEVELFAEQTQQANGMMFGADGYLYAAQSGSNSIVRYDTVGNEEVILEDAPCNDVTTLPVGGYYTDPENNKIWYVNDDAERMVVDEGIEFPNGLIPSADQSSLYVADTKGRFVYIYQIQPDGSLKHKQRYGYLHVPVDANDSGADGMTVDTEGRLYVATRMGVQVLDQLGRVNFIISKPDSGWLSNVVFGGPNRDVLYATIGGRVYKRKLNAKGVLPWQEAVTPPKPSL